MPRNRALHQIKKIAADWDKKITDGPDEEGEMFERNAIPSDYFPSPYANDEQGLFFNSGALPPDLSVIVKARPGGEDYIYSLLTGYGHEPDPGFAKEDNLFYNPYFTSGQLAMVPPLGDGYVTYTDGTQATLEKEAHDVTSFLAWAAEPTMNTRKSMGLKVMIYLIILTSLLFWVNRRVWSKLKD